MEYSVTGINIFGLSKRFYGSQLPTNDPDECGAASMAAASMAADNMSPSIFHPYPNRSSFLLGDWYWNCGVQKTQENFKTLLNIIMDPSFSSEDIRDTRWSRVNTLLGTTTEPSDIQDDANSEWLDEDAGWKRSIIRIKVPFHQRAAKPGPQDYIVGELHHRSITQVIKERMAASGQSYFHTNPYELLWKPNENTEARRVYGEMYTSDAFLKAHRDLMNSPNDCQAPRAIVALMFWSDATHLTSFGQAKLWPLYMFFGNDSKYRRAKVSSNLCNHIAYFQKVRLSGIHS
jgi:Plavaka transposase